MKGNKRITRQARLWPWPSAGERSTRSLYHSYAYSSSLFISPCPCLAVLILSLFFSSSLIFCLCVLDSLSSPLSVSYPHPPSSAPLPRRFTTLYPSLPARCAPPLCLAPSFFVPPSLSSLALSCITNSPDRNSKVDAKTAAQRRIPTHAQRVFPLSCCHKVCSP